MGWTKATMLKSFSRLHVDCVSSQITALVAAWGRKGLSNRKVHPIRAQHDAAWSVYNALERQILNPARRILLSSKPSTNFR